MSDYINTYRKIKFHFGEEFNPDEINIEDIAHSLAMQCRANGHIEQFYSVAQHCISCCREAKARGYSDRVQLCCLLHDASEAYIADIPRPAKKMFKHYLTLEKQLSDAIYIKFMGAAPTDSEMALISEIDDAMLYYEFVALADERLYDTAPAIAAEFPKEYLLPKAAEAEYLALFRELSKAV